MVNDTVPINTYFASEISLDRSETLKIIDYILKSNCSGSVRLTEDNVKDVLFTTCRLITIYRADFLQCVFRFWFKDLSTEEQISLFEQYKHLKWHELIALIYRCNKFNNCRLGLRIQLKNKSNITKIIGEFNVEGLWKLDLEIHNNLRGFRTKVYTLKEISDEGTCEDLIEGLCTNYKLTENDAFEILKCEVFNGTL